MMMDWRRALLLTVAAGALPFCAADANSISDGGVYPNSLFIGGSKDAAPLLIQLTQCLNATTSAAGCTNLGVPAADWGIVPYQYAIAAIGDGPGLEALVNEANNLDFSMIDLASSSPGVTSQSAFPFWDLTLSTAPLDSDNYLEPDTGTFLANYGYSLELANPRERGKLWQLPIAATMVQFAYNLPPVPVTSGGTSYSAAAFQFTPPTIDGESTMLRLTTDAICYIYTGLDRFANPSGATAYNSATGTYVQDTVTINNPGLPPSIIGLPGQHDWNNWVFTSFNHQIPLYAGPLVTDPVSGLGVVTGAPVITPLVRRDGSGGTYLLSIYLSRRCPGYANEPSVDPVTGATLLDANGNPLPGTSWWGTPSALPTMPSWIVPAATPGTGQGFTPSATNGPNGLLWDLTHTVGAIGYHEPGPNLSQPQNAAPPVYDPVSGMPTSGAMPTAYVQNQAIRGVVGPQFVAPTKVALYNSFYLVTPPAPTRITAGKFKGLSGTAARSWGSTLNHKMYVQPTNGAYAVTGLTYLMGYQCYQHDATDDRFDAVYQLTHAIWVDHAMDTILTNNGLYPLSVETATNGKGLTMNQAAWNVLSDGVELSAPGILTGLTNNPLTALQFVQSTLQYGSPPGVWTGPLPCTSYGTDPSHG